MPTQQNASMISEVSICNQALTWLGQQPITSLDQSSTAAQWMRENYPFLRDAVLEERSWSFALARYKSTSATRDGWDIAYLHPIPTDWLMVLEVYCSVTDGDRRDWELSTGWSLESGSVLSEDPIVYLRGLRRETNTGKFSAMFVQALAARIAMDAAMPLTEDGNMMAMMAQLYRQKLDAAANRDGMQGTNDIIKSDALINVRR